MWLNDLMDLYPDRYQGSQEFCEIQKALDTWQKRLWQDKEVFLKQLNVETATWGLSLWEDMLGLKTRSGGDADRRERILSKLRRAGTTTLERVKQIAESFVENGVVVREYPNEFRFEIEFAGKGRPKRAVDLANVLDEIKPAHLVYRFIYFFFTHGERGKYTHAFLKGYTHKQIKEEVLDG